MDHEIYCLKNISSGGWILQSIETYKLLRIESFVSNTTRHLIFKHIFFDKINRYIMLPRLDILVWFLTFFKLTSIYLYLLVNRRMRNFSIDWGLMITFLYPKPNSYLFYVLLLSVAKIIVHSTYTQDVLIHLLCYDQLQL